AVIHCPVAAPDAARSNSDRDRVRAKLWTSSDAVVVVQVSRLEAWKGHVALLEALSLLRDRMEWVCWIVGYPQTKPERSYLAHLKACARSRRIGDRVRFHETVEDVRAVYNAADVFCQAN